MFDHPLQYLPWYERKFEVRYRELSVGPLAVVLLWNLQAFCEADGQAGRRAQGRFQPELRLGAETGSCASPSVVHQLLVGAFFYYWIGTVVTTK